MATATVTISRALSTDSKRTVPANPQYHGGNVTNFRPIVQQLQPQQQQQANHPGNNQPQMTQMQTPSPEQSSQTASSPGAELPAGQQQLPAAQPAQQAQPAPAPAPTPRGPVSAARPLPPRPKPGRKPMEPNTANDRRKLQNREAQRQFRDKRAQKVIELTRDLEEHRKALDAAQQSSVNALHAKQERINNLLNDVRVANELAAKLERQLNEERAARQAAEREVMQSREQHSRSVNERMGFPNSVVQTIGTSMALPPIANSVNTGMHHGHATQAPDPFAEHEIDITAQWSNGMLHKGPVNPNNNVDWTSSDMDVDKADDDKCGFCTDSGPCPCREETRRPKPVLAPGGCDACIADPERAARCKALAEKSEVTQRPEQFTTANGVTQLRSDSVAQPTYVSCSSLLDRTNPRIPSIAELFPGTFRAYPSQNSSAGFDVAEHEVAHVLQNMSRNSGSGGGAPPS